MGRKSKYTEDIPEKVREWCKDGLIESQICKKIGISTQAFAKWKHKYVDLVEALKSGKEKVDDGVENTLLKRAMGYDYEEITTSVQNKGKEQNTEVKKVKKHIVPDVTAQIFWLKNRRPAKWREKNEVVIEDHRKTVSDLFPSEEELQRKANELDKP